MSRNARTGSVNLIAEIGGWLESGNGFASEDVNSGNLGKEIE
jgi:hypothetical protein